MFCTCLAYSSAPSGRRLSAVGLRSRSGLAAHDTDNVEALGRDTVKNPAGRDDELPDVRVGLVWDDRCAQRVFQEPEYPKFDGIREVCSSFRVLSGDVAEDPSRIALGLSRDEELQRHLSSSALNSSQVWTRPLAISASPKAMHSSISRLTTRSHTNREMLNPS